MKPAIKRIKRSIIISIFILSGSTTLYYFWPATTIPEGIIIDKILVIKSTRKLIAYSEGKPIVTYSIALGKNPTGKKQYEGDGKTPEGIYTINDKNLNSGYHLNMGISYPDTKDSEHARQTGKPAGGDIKIHGLKNGQGYIGKFQRWKDWTNGCIALTNEELDQLFKHTPIGTVIQIKP